MRAILWCTFLAVLPPAGQGPVAPDVLGAISGVVVEASGRQPVAGAVVLLVGEHGSARSQRRQITDLKGRFVFGDLPTTDRYTLSATKAGFLTGFHAAANAPPGASAPITLRPDEWMSTATVALYAPGSITGRVIDEVGEPIAGVLVRLLPRVRVQGRDELAAGPIAVTDDRGAYRFAGLPPGRYLAEVPSVQTSIPSSTPAPMSGDRLSGARTPAPTLAMDGAALLLDRYVTPPPPDGRPRAYPVTFYPGTTVAADAMAVDLDYATAKTGIDIRLTPVTVHRVSGRITGPDDAFATLTLRLVPVGLENLGWGSEAATALVDAGGRFTFLNVPEGAYVLDGPRSSSELALMAPNDIAGLTPPMPGPPGYAGYSFNTDPLPSLPGFALQTSTYRASDAPNFWVRMPLVISADTASIVAPLRPMGTLSGRIVFEADPAGAATPTFAQVLLDPAGGAPGLGMPRAPTAGSRGDGFTILGIAPAPYLLRVNAGPGWMVKAIDWNGRDFLAAPFDPAATGAIDGVRVVMTNALPTIDGAVTGGDAVMTAGATVLFFPIDRGGWTNYGVQPVRLKAVPVSAGGRYATALPAGDYFAIAVGGRVPDGWMSPDYLERAARVAARVSVAWGRATTTDLTIEEVRR